MNTKELEEENAVLTRMYADALQFMCHRGMMADYVQYVNDNLDYLVLDKDELN